MPPAPEGGAVVAPAGRRVTIARIDAYGVALPLRAPMKMAGVELVTADNLIVKVSGTDGGVGWGEAASAPSMTGETVDSMLAAVRYLAPFLQGLHADDYVAIDREMAWRLYGNNAAKGAIDMALLDLLSRSRAVPMHALLGPAVRQQMAAFWLIGTGSLEGDLQQAHDRRNAGYEAFKIKIGVDGARADADRTLAICEALADAALVCADANQGFDERAAIEYVRAVEHSRLDFVEQPVPAHDVRVMARVAAASGIAIGADEGIHGEDDIRRHHEHHAAEGCSLKIIKLGGPRAVLRAAHLCQSLGLHVNLAGKIAESSIASAALLHLACAIPELAWGVSPTHQYLAEDLVSDPIALEGGTVRVPMGAGLGVAVQESRVAEFAARH